jgi:hypothetical protein
MNWFEDGSDNPLITTAVNIKLYITIIVTTSLTLRLSSYLK